MQEWLLALDDFDSHFFISFHINSLDYLTKRSLPYSFDKFVSIVDYFVLGKDVIVVVIIPAIVLGPASLLF